MHSSPFFPIQCLPSAGEVRYSVSSFSSNSHSLLKGNIYSFITEAQSSLASQVSIAFLWVQRMCILNSCSLMGSYFLLEYVHWTPSAVLQTFWASTYRGTCIIVIYRWTYINSYTRVVFFQCKGASYEFHLCFATVFSLTASDLVTLGTSF